MKRIVLGIALVAGFLGSPPPVGAQLPKSKAARPLQAGSGEVRVPNACPFEGCRFGPWRARQTVRLFQAINGAPTGTLRAGTRIIALGGEVRAVPRRAMVIKVWDSDRAAGLRVGSIVDVLHPGGEGTIVVRHGGRIIQGSLDLNLRYERPLSVAPLRWTWWVRVQLDGRKTAWVRNPQREFSGMDEFGGD
ncbi:MAG TPA: hypothetical protein VFP12_10175 [Allosphingosinicella sp.]|nr:hypothetical protein [Allosphingosinicella sp.]